MKAVGCEKVYKGKASGVKADQPELQKVLKHVRDGDTIVIWKLDSLARSLTHLVELVNKFDAQGVGLISLHYPIDTTTAQGRLVFRIFASLEQLKA